jgi:S1-C subfamily serine protease
VIIDLDGKKILDPSELPRMVAFGHIGKTVTLKIIRKGNVVEIRAVIEIKPEK